MHVGVGEEGGRWHEREGGGREREEWEKEGRGERGEGLRKQLQGGGTSPQPAWHSAQSTDLAFFRATGVPLGNVAIAELPAS